MQTDRFADRLEIHDLVLAYAEAVDAQDPPAIAALFAANAVFRAYDRPQGEAHGPGEIRDLMAKLIHSFRATLHHVSAPRLHFSGPDAATGATSLHAWHAFRTERPDALLWGRYHDAFVRTPDGWRFASRELRVSGHQDFDFPWIPAH